MVEGGVVKVDKTEFTECFRAVGNAPYNMVLAFTSGIGGFLFGYDTGVISGALLYMKEDFEQVQQKTWLQECIVGMAVAGAIVGAGVGGYLSDRIGRKPSMIIADIMFIIGKVVSFLARRPWIIIIGRLLAGLGIGIASVTSPIYISETSPTKIRGALVATNNLLVTSGQFLAFLINLAFTQVPGTWRWMLGVAIVPAAIQIVLMLTLPESPRWLFRQNKIDEAEEVLRKIYPEDQVKEEMDALKSSIETEIAEKKEVGEGNVFVRMKKAWSDKVVRRSLIAGISSFVVQQLVGINTVMYYTPTILQLAGFASSNTALALSLITAGLNAVGSVISMVFVDRYGRRKLMLLSMMAIITCLAILSGIFFAAARSAPEVGHLESAHFGANATCPAYVSASYSSSWSCTTCLKKGCAFIANGASQYLPGACVAASNNMKKACEKDKRQYFTEGCPSKYGFLAVIFLGLFIIAYSPGMGTVPWILNSEIYPMRYRGICSGIGTAILWCTNLIVSMTFLTLTDALGMAGTFLLYGGFSVIGLIILFFVVPETKGMSIEEIERMLDKGFHPTLCGGGEKENEQEETA